VSASFHCSQVALLPDVLFPGCAVPGWMVEGERWEGVRLHSIVSRMALDGGRGQNGRGI